MKNNAIYSIGFALILYFSFILQGTIIITNEQCDKDNSNVVLPLTASNSVAYKWHRTWGGGSDDYGWGAAVDSSGNIYLAGYTFSFGAGMEDIVLIKYDGNGVQHWNRMWGGSSSDVCWGIEVDSLGNIYLVGSTWSFGAGVYDMVLVKYDGNGVQQWNRTWGGGSADQSYGVTVDSSDNIYLAGYTWSFGAGSSDMVLGKYDGNGVQQWYRTWGGIDEDEGYRVVVNSTDHIYLVGSTWSFGMGAGDMVLVKYDGNGVQQWSRTWGGVNLDYGRGTAVDSSDNIYLAGSTTSFGAGGYDMVLVKLGSDRPPNIISYVIIVILITSLVGIGIAITFFIKKRWKIVR